MSNRCFAIEHLGPTGSRVGYNRQRIECENLHLQRRRDSPVFCNENIVGSAGGVCVHYLEPDPGVDQRTQRGRRREALPGTGTQQDNFNLQRRQKSDSVNSDVLVRARYPASFNACGLYDDACLVTLAVDFDVTGPVAGYGVAPVAVCEVEFQWTVISAVCLA